MYVQGFVLPVPASNKEAYRKVAQDMTGFFHGLGAIEVIEAWEEDVPDGQTTDFRRAVKAAGDEKVVFSWIVWPDRPTCDKAAKAMQEGEGDMPSEMPFDGKRMIFGGFAPIVVSRKAGE